RPFARKLHYKYDANGNRIEASTDKSDVATYSYDSLDRITQVYTEDDRKTTTMQYDPWSLHRIVVRIGRMGKDVVYGFDAAGRVAVYYLYEGDSAPNPGELGTNDYLESHTYVRDAAGLITSSVVSSPGGEDSRTMTLLRDAAGRILERDYGDGVKD